MLLRILVVINHLKGQSLYPIRMSFSGLFMTSLKHRICRVLGFAVKVSTGFYLTISKRSGTLENQRCISFRRVLRPSIMMLMSMPSSRIISFKT